MSDSGPPKVDLAGAGGVFRPVPQTALGPGALVSTGEAAAHHRHFADPAFEWRRLFSEVLGTFFLVLVAVGGGMVNARFGGDVIPLTAQVTAPGLMVGAIILGGLK